MVNSQLLAIEKKRSCRTLECLILFFCLLPAEGISGDATSNSLSLPQWQRNGGRENSFQSPSFISICDNSLFNCRSFQQSDNGDLAEADQSRNEETSGAESDNGFLNSQTIQQETGFAANQSHQSCESNLSRQNVPESERNFAESRNCPNGVEEGASVVEGNSGFANSTSEPEGNFSRANDNVENFRKSETPEGFFYQLNAASSSEERPSKSTTKYFKEEEESEKETAEGKASGSKNLGIKCSENSFKEFSGANVGEYENQNSANSNHSGMSLVEERQEYYPITRVNSGTLRFPIVSMNSLIHGFDKRPLFNYASRFTFFPGQVRFTGIWIRLGMRKRIGRGSNEAKKER